MLKKICTIILCLVVTVSLSIAAFAAGGTTIYVEGKRFAMSTSGFREDGTTYVEIGEFCRDLGANSVNADEETGTVTVTAEGLEMTVTPDSSFLVANGRYLWLEKTCVVRNGKEYLPMDTLMKVFGAEKTWNSRLSAICVKITDEPIESGDTFYNENDVYWLSRIINAEAGGESLEGKVAVGDVVLNRVRSSLFPDDIYDVIFDCNCGVQFSTAYNGAVYCTPNDESVTAAKLALDGADTCGNSLYFAAAYIAADCWAGQNRPYVMQIGNHCFFA